MTVQDVKTIERAGEKSRALSASHGSLHEPCVISSISTAAATLCLSFQIIPHERTGVHHQRLLYVATGLETLPRLRHQHSRLATARHNDVCHADSTPCPKNEGHHKSRYLPPSVERRNPRRSWVLVGLIWPGNQHKIDKSYTVKNASRQTPLTNRCPPGSTFSSPESVSPQIELSQVISSPLPVGGRRSYTLA